MTLLFTDGFDHYGSSDITKKWTASASCSISTTGGRRSSGAFSVGLFGGAQKSLPATYTTLVMGAALKFTTNSGYPLMQFIEGGTIHLSLCFESGTQKLQLRRGQYNGTIIATGSVVLSSSTWYYVEFKATINDTTGSTEVRINGVADSSLTLTNTDTRNGGSGYIDTVGLGQYYSGLGNGATFDDLYVCSTAGATNNNFLGDCRVDTILPTGDGNYTQFTPSTGTAHWSLVDENPPNTTDYVSSATSGNRDSYTFPDLSGLSSQTVYGIQINAAALKSDAGARSLGTMSRLSGTDKDGSGAALPTSIAYISEIQETDPASAAWTESNINAAEFGVKVTA